jgi:hypothetical protein
MPPEKRSKLLLILEGYKIPLLPVRLTPKDLNIRGAVQTVARNDYSGHFLEVFIK